MLFLVEFFFPNEYCLTEVAPYLFVMAVIKLKPLFLLGSLGHAISNAREWSPLN